MSSEIATTCGELNCTPEQYHERLDLIGHSMLDDARANPAYFHGRYVAGTIAQSEPECGMRIGTLFHLLTFQPDRWSDIAVVPDCDKRTKEGRVIYTAFLEQSAGKLIADPEELRIAKCCAAAVFAHDEASQLLALDGPTEHAIWWEDEETGLKLKSLRDKATPGIVIDGKTCRDASPRGFAKAADDFGYARQDAWYLDGHYALTGERAKFYFIAVENSEPYSVAVHELDEAWVELAREENRIAKKDLARRFAENDWLPEFSKGVNVLRMPRYAAFRNEWE